MIDGASLASSVLAGNQRALARAITRIENRTDGYRDLVATFHRNGGNARIIGVTGSPGAGKSTLVDKLTAQYRDRDLKVGVLGVDPTSPFTGGAILGDRVRMRSAIGDEGVFVRSMSTRGSLGGLSPATSDVIRAFDAYGMDRIIIETVGAGQNEVDVVKTADSVAVVVQPDSGDDVQMLKAGILEIGDVFVVNKADMDGVDRTVSQLQEMLELGRRHGAEAGEEWEPPILETVATDGDGVGEVLEGLDAHHAYLESTGSLASRRHDRHTSELRRLLRNELSALVEAELERRGGIDHLVERLDSGEADPYTLAGEVLEPIQRRLAEQPDSG